MENIDIYIYQQKEEIMFQDNPRTLKLKYIGDIFFTQYIIAVTQRMQSRDYL